MRAGAVYSSVWAELSRPPGALTRWLSPAAIPAALAGLSGEDHAVRIECARILVALEAEEAVPAFLHALQEESNADEVQVLAAAFLGSHAGRRREPDVVPALSAVLDRWHRHASVSVAAARALGGLGDARAVPVLAGALKAHDDELVRSAIRSLVELGDAGAVEPLLEVLAGYNDDRAQEAAEALGRIGHPSAVPALVEVMEPAKGGRLGKRAERLATAAARSLGQIGDQAAVEPLMEVLGRDPWVSAEAAGSLARLGATRAIPYLHALLRSDRGFMARHYAQALGDLGDTIAIRGAARGHRQRRYPRGEGPGRRRHRVSRLAGGGRCGPAGPGSR